MKISNPVTANGPNGGMAQVHWKTMRWMRAVSVLALATAPLGVFAQLRMAAYNLSNYSGFGRAADIQTLFFGEFEGRKFAPDAIVLQEFLTQTALTTFVTLLNSAPGSPGDYAAPPFIDGADTDSVFCYRTSKIQFLQQVVVSFGSGATTNQPRNIQRYDFRPAGYSSEGATISYYSTHMKAGTTQTDIDRRLIEAVKIRNDAELLNPARHFALGGDFNIPASAEAGYLELIGSQANNQGRFWDPIKSPGTWGGSSFRFIHTQDPAGGGGMDDRYDQILLSASLIDGAGFDYIGNPNQPFSSTTWNDPNHSYRCWGNDGSTYNLALRITGNAMVGAAIAQALVNAADGSGHLPVYLDMRVPARAQAPITQVNFGRVLQGLKPLRANITVRNSGVTAQWGVAGIANLNYTFSATSGFIAPAGEYVAAPGQPATNHTIWMDTRVAGFKTGQIFVHTDDPEQPIHVIQVSGYVIPTGG